MPDGRKGWDGVWGQARLAGQVCTRALVQNGFRVGDPGKLEEALAELFLTSLRMPLPFTSGAAQRDLTGGEGKG